VATLGLGAAGWLALAPVAFGYRKAGPHDAALTDWATGAGLAVVSVLNSDALLIVLVQPSTNVGALLYDLRRHRTAIARLL
jgi:hypothetical protein